MQNDFLSDYHIKETIGKGTFSIVKLGINKATNEKVAIKILKKKKILHKADKSRLEREISILKKLNHINVINSHKINEDSDNYYIVMEYCENGELFNYIVDRQKLDEDEASYFFYQLINGLDYIHHKNIVHRDLKPENLLLGKGNILKIIDFGLSNYYDEEKLLSTPCGSPCYASPEMVCGNKYNGLMIDIWSCGIIIFAMTCGFLPFEDTNNELLFKKIMKCRVDYPEFLSNNTLDIMKKILVVDPHKRITIEQIRKHPFYIKGKNIFEYKHKNLVCKVEKIIDDNLDESNNNEENSKDENTDDKKDINIKKSKSTNYFENENIIKNNNKYKIKRIFIDNNIVFKENGNNSTMSKGNSSKTDKNNKSYGLISKKFHISIKSKDKDNINQEIDKIKSINYELKDINNNNINNDFNSSNQIEESKKNLKKIQKNALSLREKNHKDKYEKNKLEELNTQNFPLSNDLYQKLPDFETQNFIEEYQNIGKNQNNNIIHNGKSKINLSLLQQLLKKEKSSKYYKDKNYFIHSPAAKKNSDSLSYVLPPTKKKSEDKINNNNKTEFKSKIKSLNNENDENNSEQIDENSNPTNRSDNSNNNSKSILSYNNKHHDNLELIKYGISNKDINDILFKYNKNIKKFYESNTTKNKQATNIENIVNKENDTNTNNFNSELYNNIHIKNLRILNNNNYNNIKNITNINNVKSINNIIICNSPMKSLIKDVQYLTKINSNNNNDLPNINLNSNMHKELKTMTSNINSINNINNYNISNTNKNNITSPTNNNNILIPKMLMTKDINNLGIYNNYNTTNLSKMYIGSLNKKLNNVNKKNSVKNMINNYRNNASSIEYLNKKAMSKNHFSERNLISYGFDFSNENGNNSINKKSHIVYTTKNKMNLNKIKNKVDPFTYGRNNENLITLKKIKYNDGNNNNNNFNTEKNNTKKISENNLIK